MNKLVNDHKSLQGNVKLAHSHDFAVILSVITYAQQLDSCTCECMFR